MVNPLRREFLTTTASGLGAMALGSMLTRDGLIGPDTAVAVSYTHLTLPTTPYV